MIMQRTGTGVNQKIYDKIIDDNKFKDEDGFIPPEILCCCEYQRADNEQGIHIAQHCMECSEVDSIIEGIICQCKLDPNRCFNAIQSKSLFPFPGGAHIIPVEVWCVLFPLFVIYLFFVELKILSYLLFCCFLLCCVLPYMLTSKKKQSVSKKIDDHQVSNTV